MDSFAETIRNIPFFSGLSRQDLARLAGKLEEEKFSSGDAIVKQGESGDALYVVRSGAVEVVLENDEVGAESLAVLNANECFGEMALFTGQKRSATVRAFVDSLILKLSQENWDELLKKYPSIGMHFCRVLSRRLAETDRDISKGLGTFHLVMEEFFALQSPPVRDFLIRTSTLKTLEPEVIQTVLSIGNTKEVLSILASNYPTFLQIGPKGHYEYRDYLRDFLAAKLKQTAPTEQSRELHRRIASYFAKQARWADAIHHFAKAEAWDEALELIKTHGEALLERESPKEILSLLETLPDRVCRQHSYVAELQAEAYNRLGDIDSAIRSYQTFLVDKPIAETETVEISKCYQKLANLHQKKGEIGEAIGCLRVTEDMLGKRNLEAVAAMDSIQALEQKRGLQDRAFQSGRRAVSVTRNLTRVPSLLKGKQNWTGAFLAILAGLVIWHIPPPPPLDERGMHFLATLTTAVIFWAFEVFDQYVVALVLLLSWIQFGIAPPRMALAGFSQSSWFFVLAALGIGAAVTNSGLLYRVALQVLRRLPSSYKIYTFVLAASGLLA
ncbi:MAG: cyclic nucleotide-binding domain-containing protein, partial [Candidatus Binatia bacterium]